MRRKKHRYFIYLGGHRRGRAEVSQEDFVWACMFHWHKNPDGYARRSQRREGGKGGWGCRSMHRDIYERILGRKIPKNMVIDHRNRKRNDNRRENLRMCTIRTNNHNRRNILLWDGEQWIYKPHGRAE